jgi:hypothetical protein
VQAKLLDTLKRLRSRGAWGIRKRIPEQQRPIPFASCFGEDDFFFRGGLQRRVTPEGRPYLESLRQREFASIATVPGSDETNREPLVGPGVTNIGDTIIRLAEAGRPDMAPPGGQAGRATAGRRCVEKPRYGVISSPSRAR